MPRLRLYLFAAPSLFFDVFFVSVLSLYISLYVCMCACARVGLFLTGEAVKIRPVEQRNRGHHAQMRKVFGKVEFRQVKVILLSLFPGS